MHKKPQIYFVDSKIAQFHEDELGLVFHLTGDACTYAIFDVKTGENLAYISSEGKTLADIKKSDELLSFNYSKTYLLLSDIRTTFVPDKIYADDLAIKFAKLNWSFDDTKQNLQTENIGHLNSELISLIDTKTYQSLQKVFPNGQFISSYCILTKLFLKLAASDKRHKHQVFANIEDERFDLFVFERQHLTFANTFKYKNSSDFIYFFLHVVNRLKIDTGDIKFQLCGVPSKDLLEAIEQHVMNVVILNKVTTDMPVELPITKDFILLNTGLCVL